MLNRIKNLWDRPLALAVIGWICFPAMYLVGGMLTAFKIDFYLSFGIASPLGIVGVLAWIVSVVAAFRISVWKTKPAQAILGLILSALPLLFLAFGYYIAATGGV